LRFTFLLVFAFWLPATAASVVVDGRQEMTEGVQLFRSGNLAEARERLEQAHAAGFESSSLYYNLGVVCYQLEDYPAAERWFRRLLDGPEQALARYNLGLVALADGRVPAAQRWFRSVLDSDAREKIRSLAMQQLTRLESSSASSAIGTAGTEDFVSLGGGYDSYLSATPEDAPSNRGSSFVELAAAGSVDYSLNEKSWLSWDVLGFSVNYPGDREFSQQTVQGRMAVMATLGDWSFGVRPGISRSWLGGDELETRLGLELLAYRHSCFRNSALDCRLSLAADRVDAARGYRPYDGQWYQFRASGFYTSGRLEAGAEYRLEFNDRQDLQTTDYFASVSPTRHEWRLDAGYRVSPGWKPGAELSVRYSRYRDMHQWLEAGEPVVRRRTDLMTGLGVFSEHSLDRNWSLRLQGLFRHQDSRLDSYDYQRHTLQVSLEGVF
jgi:hypothetical protein